MWYDALVKEEVYFGGMERTSTIHFSSIGEIVRRPEEEDEEDEHRNETQRERQDGQLDPEEFLIENVLHLHDDFSIKC